MLTHALLSLPPSCLSTGEETVAIFARTVPEPTVSKAAAEALMAHKAIEPISKLFSKFGRRKRQIGYRLNGAQA